MGLRSEIFPRSIPIYRGMGGKPVEGRFLASGGYMRELAVWVLCISGVCFSLCLLFSGVVLIAGSGVRDWILWGAILFIFGGVILCAAAYVLWGG